MKKITFLSLFIISLVDIFSQQAVPFYVSPSGRDNNPRSIENPFATLEKARNAVRDQLNKNHSDSIVVYLQE